jgi:hypothetical protein
MNSYCRPAVIEKFCAILGSDDGWKRERRGLRARREFIVTNRDYIQAESVAIDPIETSQQQGKSRNSIPNALGHACKLEQVASGFSNVNSRSHFEPYKTEGKRHPEGSTDK